MIRIQPYKAGSKSCRELSSATGIKRLRVPTTAWLGKARIINWGSSNVLPGATYVMNHPNRVAVASNKLDTMVRFEECSVPTVPYTTSRSKVSWWLESGHLVFARTKLTGNSGEGIVMLGRGMPIVAASLYTLYIKKMHEYRVHVFNGQVLYVQAKLRRRGNYEGSYHIRNTANGYVFATDGVSAPDCVREAALHAVHALGLNYGAVDVGHTVRTDTAAVYEVNTAPGLEGTTLATVAAAIKEAYCG